MLFTFLLIVQTLVAAAMVGVILMQRSEGGGLGVGGSPAGLMSARGAADFLTRSTAVLGTLFVVLSIALAGLAAVERAPSDIDPSLSRRQQGPAPLAPGGAAPGQVPGAIPGQAPAGAVPGAAIPGQAPAGTDPLAGAAQQAPAAQTPAQPAAPANSTGQ
jgi:preprotein translocase subunit SecG